MINIIKCLLFFVMFFCVSCGNNNTNSLDTTTSGNIKISVDQTVQPLIEAELDVFHSFYPKAHINASFVSEKKAVEKLMQDSSRIAIISRKLSSEELTYFQKLKLSVHTTKIASGGIAFIINRNNKDSLLNAHELNGIFSGKIKYWNELRIKNRSSQDHINVVFDNESSSTVRFIKETLHVNKFPSSNFFALKSNSEVIDYVGKHNDALGVIGVNWISDSDDDATGEFLKKIKVIGIDFNKPGFENIYIKPYQAYLANEYYLFKTSLYVVSREARTGLGTGFISFLAGEKGQRIVLKSGMVPAAMPVRLVEIKN